MVKTVIDFVEVSTYVIVIVGGIFICFIFEPLHNFWAEHTWREENGKFVRDYSALRASLKAAMSAVFYASVISLSILGFLRWCLGPYLFRDFLGHALRGGLIGIVIAYCALSIFQHHRGRDEAKRLTCWQVAFLAAFVWGILHVWPHE